MFYILHIELTLIKIEKANTIHIETINYKNKNPQVYLMG